jgi:pyruvate dehydrogenase (quinone)
MRTAIERRGVAVVVIPGEILQHEAPRWSPATAVRATTSIVGPSDHKIATTADVLNGASTVTILAGAGCQGAHDELIALPECLKAPAEQCSCQ